MFNKIVIKWIIKNRSKIASKTTSLSDLYKMATLTGLMPRETKKDIKNGDYIATIKINDINIELIKDLVKKNIKLVIIKDDKVSFNNLYLENIFIIRRYSDIKIIIESNIVTRYQIIQYLSSGADTIILKCDLISLKELIYLADIALNSGLSIILEIKDEKELEVADKLDAIAIILKNSKITKIGNNLKVIKKSIL